MFIYIINFKEEILGPLFGISLIHIYIKVHQHFIISKFLMHSTISMITFFKTSNWTKMTTKIINATHT